MNCPTCNEHSKKNGKDRDDNQRYKCTACGKRFSEPKARLLGSMQLPEEKAVMCLKLLVEGASIRSIERVTGVHRDTVLSLLETVGKKCLWIQENLVKNVRVTFMQADEIWSFIGMKDKTKHAKNINDTQIGTAYTFTSIDADSKLIIAWHLGRRTEDDAYAFLDKVYNAIDHEPYYQITTDGWKGYSSSVPNVLGRKANFAQLIKIYGPTSKKDETRYSPAECIGCKTQIVAGQPIKEFISTSHVERQNLTMRMSMRRFTRLTNGFSKKWDNLNYMLAIYFAYYNFCRLHKTIRCTPAMAAGLSGHIWDLKELMGIA